MKIGDRIVLLDRDEEGEIVSSFQSREYGVAEKGWVILLDSGEYVEIDRLYFDAIRVLEKM